MEWTCGWLSRPGLIANITKDYIGNEKKYDCIEQCYRGNPYRGVLWSVWVITNRKTMNVLDSFIQCDILAYRNREWCYKGLCESSGPYYYSCPLKYLDMAPVPDSKYAVVWREKVRVYHAKHNKKLKTGATYEAAPGTKLNKRLISRIRVDSQRPMRATVIFEDGTTTDGVKFKKTHVQEQVK